jgi:hypothetical protein
MDDVALRFRPFRRLRNWCASIRRRLPYLVWQDDELDVRVTLTEARLHPFEFRLEEGFPVAAVDYLSGGHCASIERALGEMGIEFDKGGGIGGRDWEWDWSLRGPISVRFRSRATKPELRK